MKIINLDAEKQLTLKIHWPDVLMLVLDVVRPLEKEFLDSPCLHFGLHSPEYEYIFRKTNRYPHTPIRKFECGGYENITTLLHTIPIYLRNSQSKDDGENNIIDPLGAYFPNRKDDNPYIELFLTEIDKASKGNDLHFKWIFTKVLIHELAHAALDIHNQERCGQDKIEKIPYSTKFGKWREESMANAAALHIIKMFGDENFYNFSKQFMLSQPAEYALGVLMEDLSYRDLESVTRGKEKGVNEVLKQKWLEIVKGNPTSQELDNWNTYLSHPSVYVYQGKYYTSEDELVYDIVDNVLKEYQKSNNGKKMSISEFKNLFPNIKVSGRMSYEPSEKVRNTSSYTQIELEDGNLSLYKYSWDNELLHEFTKNINCGFTEYINY